MTNASRRLIQRLEVRAARNAESRDIRRTMGEHTAAAIFGAWAEATEACLADVRELLEEPEAVPCNCGGDEFFGHDPYCQRNPLYEWSPGELQEAFGR